MANYTTISSDKSKGMALGLCCLGFIGLGGIHDFYLGNYGKAIIKLFTANWFMIGTIIDAISIASGSYRDNAGAPLRTSYNNDITTVSNNVNESHIKQYSISKKEEDTTVQLARLGELKDKGYITEEEFNQKKQDLLNRI